MRQFRTAFILIFMLVGGLLLGQNRSLQFTSGSDYVNFDLPKAATNNVRTISFWIRPNNGWNPGMNEVEPIVVKDKYGLVHDWGGRFAIYVEEGKIKWSIHDYSTSTYSIRSDRDVWQADVWYHVACVLDPTSGMKMYVNGQLQSETNSRSSLPPPPNEGPDEAFFVGCWGSQRSLHLDAVVDELRLWSTARTQTEIRTLMCRQVSCINHLIACYNFNLRIAGTIEDECLTYTISNEPSVKTTSYKISTAPLGTTSAHLYSANWANQKLKYQPGRDSIILSNLNLGGNEGIHIYFTPGGPLNLSGLPDTITQIDGIIGVWSSDFGASWDIRVKFARTLPLCADCSYMAHRDLPGGGWDIRSELPTVSECGFSLLNQSDNQKQWREEYLAIDELSFSPSLPDTLSVCSNDPAMLQAFVMPGADYEWDNGNTTSSRFVVSSGTYWVKMKYERCIKYDTVFVFLDSMPSFTWDRDTVICEGDTAEIICPLPGVKYLWDTGDTTQSIKVWEKGLYEVTTTYGNCSYTDIIAVQIIPDFDIDLGPSDTLLCLGQSMSWRFNPILGDYRWWNNSTSSSAEVFNVPGEYWVRVENDCFTVFDTIQIAFEDCDCRIDIPNTFTPNDDWVNDQTGVYTRCYFQEFDFVVMDRWGNRVYHSTNPQERWDGTYMGEPCEQGTFVYRLRYRRYTGPEEPVVRTGRMMLVR